MEDVFLSEYIQDIASITAETAQNWCTDRVWSIWKVGFGDVACVFSAKLEILILSPTARTVYMTSEWHRKAGVRDYLSMRDYSNEYGIYPT